MKVVTVELSAVRQLKDSLANFQGSSVNLVKEQDHRLFTSHLEPIRRIEAGAIAFNARQTNQVTLGHLAGTALNNRQAGSGCQLINNLALTNTVATTEKNRQTSSTH
jgi:hypothetical protein